MRLPTVDVPIVHYHAFVCSGQHSAFWRVFTALYPFCVYLIKNNQWCMKYPKYVLYMFKSNTNLGITCMNSGVTCPISKSYFEGTLTCPLDWKFCTRLSFDARNCTDYCRKELINRRVFCRLSSDDRNWPYKQNGIERWRFVCGGDPFVRSS